LRDDRRLRELPDGIRLQFREVRLRIEHGLHREREWFRLLHGPGGGELRLQYEHRLPLRQDV
jgi:hypothetical protein